MTSQSFPMRQIRSFVRRDSRMTDAQRRAFQSMWPTVGLALEEGILDFRAVFQREAPTIFEIGFGSGHSLLAMAKANPEQNFIGVETHRPGIGTLLQGIEAEGLTNLRVFYGDAVEVFSQCIADNSLDVIQIFFPDPWQKRRHHKRRLIQHVLVDSLVKKLKPNGTLHLATDWEDYAKHMMAVLSDTPALRNIAGIGEYANRSSQRPIVTKFERRGQESGRAIWELQFVRDVGSAS